MLPTTDLSSGEAIDAESIGEEVGEAFDRSPRSAETKPPAQPTRSCYLCGNRAVWRIAVAGEDDKPTDEDACEAHANGHLRIAYISS